MDLKLIVTLGVFAPLLGAAIVGLSGRRLGNVVSQTITTGLLFFSCACASFRSTHREVSRSLWSRWLTFASRLRITFESNGWSGC